MTLRRIFLVPAWLVLFVLFAVPLAIVASISFHERGAYGGVTNVLTAESYVRLADSLYAGVFLKTVGISLIATILTLVLAFPLALQIARAGKHSTFLLQLVLLPFWTSFLIRLYAWVFLLRETGPVNQMLSSPLPFLYTDGAVLLGLVYGHLPFAVLPLYAVLERLDPTLEDAAADLGGTPRDIVLCVVLPQARPGLIAAGALVFIACLGAYLVPDLLGGAKTLLLGNLIQNQFTTARDWPFGAALSLATMVLTCAVLAVVRRRTPELV